MSNSLKERKVWEKNYTQRVLVGIVVALMFTIGAFNITTVPGETCVLPEDTFAENEDIFQTEPVRYKLEREMVPEVKEKRVSVAPPIFTDPVFKVVNNQDPIIDMPPEEFIDDGPIVIPPPVNKAPLVYAEIMPEFPGGKVAMMKYFEKVGMCEEAKVLDIEGRLFAEFVVDENGKITNVGVIKKLFPCLDERVERLIKNMPAWSPGKQGGKAVKVIMRVPFNFKIT